jgi:hypothetical protein
MTAERVMVNGVWVVEGGTVRGIDYQQLADVAVRERTRLMRAMT